MEGNTMDANTPRRVRRDEAAEFLGLSPRTLDNMRYHGDGPPYYKLGGAVVYDALELESWLQARRCTSTSNYSRRGPAA